MAKVTYNERAWAGQIISWIKQAINDGTTLFQDATNDEGLKVASGRTKFPDILLFIDKVSGIVFNGREFKSPHPDRQKKPPAPSGVRDFYCGKER